MNKIGFLIDDKVNAASEKPAGKKGKKSKIDYATIYNRFIELSQAENKEIS